VDTVRAGDYNFFPTEKEAKIINWELEFFLRQRIMSAVKKAEFVNDWVSVILRVRWCDIIVLNVHAPSK